MNRAEHLAWAKQRALEYVDRGDLQTAVISMASDLQKHEAWANSGMVIGMLVTEAAMFEIPKGPHAVRRWIEGFN